MSLLRARLLWPLLGLGLLLVASCARTGDATARAEVKTDFDVFRQALLTRHADQVVTYLPANVGDYLETLKTGSDSPAMAGSALSGEPGVNLLLRTVLAQKVPSSVRPHLNLQELLQRLGDRGLLDCREIRDVSLGHVSVEGDRANAELYFRGNLLPLRVPFVRQSGVWKVDLLSMLPYAEVLMRLDRAITGKSQSQQVAQIVSPLPLL